MQTNKVGWGVSADTETMADTVTPCRPAAPSVVTTFTVHAAWLIPDKKRCRKAGSVSGCALAFLSLIRPFRSFWHAPGEFSMALTGLSARRSARIDKHYPSAYISAPRVRRTHLAQVAELVDALVSGTSGAIRGGSSPLLGTTALTGFDIPVSDRKYDLVLYGASGFTGRQTVEYCKQFAPAGFSWAI